MKKLFVLLSALAILPTFTSAQTPDPVTAFRRITNVPALAITVPTVIEVPFAQNDVETPSFLVVDKVTGDYLPWYWHTESEDLTPIYAHANGADVAQLTDRDFTTAVDLW